MRNPFRRKRTLNLIEQYDSEAPGTIEVQRLFKTIYGKGVNRLKSLIVTSAMPQEGKSLLVGNLALVAAHADRKTLIIDADMRRPCQHHQFRVARTPGLSEYLTQDATVDQVIHDTDLENLKLIPCGARVPSPGGLLQSNLDILRQLLDQSSLCHEVILIDVPPVVPVNDTEWLSALVDGVILVVMAGKTYREILDRAIELLRQSNCNLLGIVLNNVSHALPYYYEHRYYGYRYGDPHGE